MKKLYFILSLVCFTTIANAQETPSDASEKKQQDMQALKAAFITKELDLTPDEAQKFWPVYNQYEKEIAVVLKDKDLDNDESVLDKEQRVLDIKKKYKDQFGKVLGNQQRVNRLYDAQNKFRKLLIKALQKRQMKRNLRNNRPGLRDN